MQTGWSWKQELTLWFYQILAWITWNTYWFKRARGLSVIKSHIASERAKMSRTLWLTVMVEGKWTCMWCGVKNDKNQEIGKPKMEVDHIKPLFHGGYTVRSNLQVLCQWCNRKKGMHENRL